MARSRNEDFNRSQALDVPAVPVSRRMILQGLSLAALAASAAPALAQAPSWAEAIFGQNSASSRPPADERKKPEALNDLRPNAIPYRSDAMIEALESAILNYQNIVERGGWPGIPGVKMIRPDDDDERVPVLRRRLMVTGELKNTGSVSSFSLDGELELAVRRFQENHGLRVSGRVDKPTLQAMNVPAPARLAQLKLNLGRLRELSTQRVEDRYVLVNPPAFQLEAVERGEVQQRHRVIAGRVERQTPVVKATIRALNFFPYWRVPDSVATLDLIPKMRKEPEYIAREKIRVLTRDFNGPEIDQASVDWNTASATQIKFRQDPGPQNALGLMRIDMPNSEGVYMHDTPMKPLFQQRARAFSAGCVRVQDVFKLGEWIARNELGWDQPGRIDGIIEGGQPLDLTLTHPIPVYFTYITAWAEPGGTIQFRPDLYGRDGAPPLVAGPDRDANDPPPPPQSLAP